MPKAPPHLLPMIASAMLGGTLLSSCEPPETNEATQNETIITIPASDLPRLPIAASPLDREALLLAVVHAASAHASGADDIAAQRALDGQLFELRIRFGCNPDDPDKDELGWRFDEQGRRLRLHAHPEVSLRDPLVASIGGRDFEAVEGFWVHRPWLLTASCPSAGPPGPMEQAEKQPKSGPERQPSASPASAPRRQVGIAQFFTEEDPRTQRRQERPYEATKVLEADRSPSPNGYDLVLSGRLRRLPDGRVIGCASPDPAEPPACIISAEFGRVRFERPDTNEVLAQWGGG